MILAFSDHYKRINGQSNLPKANVLCIGPSGSGKTFLIEKITEYLDLAYCIFNAASLTPTGYKGEEVSQIFVILYENALAKANNDHKKAIEIAQAGVVVLDEIDKLGRESDQEWLQGVQNQLLKIVEKGLFSFEHNKETISLKTDHILFVGLGCFEKISHGNAKKQQTRSIGFLSDKSPQFSNKINDDDLNNDLIKCGMKREFLRRFSCLVVFDPVDASMLVKFFNRCIVPYKEEFRQNGSVVAFTPDAKCLLIEKALRGIGMSALDQILREVLAKLRFNIEKYKGSKCVITCNTLKTGDVEVIPLDRGINMEK
ncbi:AAA family ATPase [Helicobacter suis]|uniref:AAA family ATPase n=1 Tax=Helicobacter suis TaxID=104628 RepID=UPI0013D49EDF|nr:AAA family ATPase [Helicobacter suis]